MTRTDLMTYTPEFRAEAVKLALEQGLSLEVAAQRLWVPKETLSNWVTAAKRGSTASTSAPGSRGVADLEAENARLRRELAVERMEKEVLKNASRASPPSGGVGTSLPERHGVVLLKAHVGDTRYADDSRK